MGYGMGVGATLGIYVVVIQSVEDVVPEGDVQQTYTYGSESEDQWSYNCVCECNDSQIGVDRVDRAPFQPVDIDITMVYLSWSGIKELSEQEPDCKSDNVSNSFAGNGDTVKNKPINVEVGGLGQTLSQKGNSACRILDDLSSYCRCCRCHGGDEEDLVTSKLCDPI